VRLLVGLCNAPAAFQKAMDMILAGAKWLICRVYLDDVIFFSRCQEKHLQLLDAVLTRLGKAVVTLRAAKCHALEEVEYVGLAIRPGKVHVPEKTLQALRRLWYPETKSQMRRFLDMGGVYRHFAADFAKIAKPLTALKSTKLHKRLSSPEEKETKASEELRGRLLADAVPAVT